MSERHTHHHEHDHEHDHGHEHEHHYEHDHEHNHEHADDCDCGCHDHDHNHEHHKHPDNCDCGCHDHDHVHNEATALVEQAVRFSEKVSMQLAGPLSAGVLEAAVTKALLQIAELIAQDGFVLGHVKALIQCKEESVALSLTQVGTASAQHSKGWNAHEIVDACTLTVNIISALPTDADFEAVWHELTSLLSK